MQYFSPVNHLELVQLTSGCHSYLLFCSARLEDRHVAEVKKLKDEVDELRSVLSQVEKELLHVRTELKAQKEANNRAPTTTIKNLVERLKSQLALKEKQQTVCNLCTGGGKVAEE